MHCPIVILSSKLGKATKEDLECVIKVIKKLKIERSKMYFPNLGDFKDWKIEAYSDDDYKSLPDKMSSCGGRVILVTNTKRKKS